MNIIVAPNSYFQHTCDVCGVLGLSSIFKHTLAIKDLTYGVVAGVSDEYCKLGEVIAMGALKIFYKVVKMFFK
jgi:hypothetical protein